MDTIKKDNILKALEQSLGVVTTACKAVGISRAVFYEWQKKDSDFSAAVAELDNVALDFAESALYKQIQEGNTSATIFYLKTKGKNRGYVERTEITGANNTPLLLPTVQVVVAALPKKE